MFNISLVIWRRKETQEETAVCNFEGLIVFLCRFCDFFFFAFLLSLQAVLRRF